MWCAQWGLSKPLASFSGIAQRVFKLPVVPDLYSVDGKKFATERSLALALYKAGEADEDLVVVVAGASPPVVVVGGSGNRKKQRLVRGK